MVSPTTDETSRNVGHKPSIKGLGLSRHWVYVPTHRRRAVKEGNKIVHWLP